MDELTAYKNRLAQQDWTWDTTEDPIVRRQGFMNMKALHVMQPRVDPDFAVWNTVAPPEHHNGAGTR